MKKIILFLFLFSCSSNTYNNSKDMTLDFKKSLTFSEFKNLLMQYNKISDYPNINE